MFGHLGHLRHLKLEWSLDLLLAVRDLSGCCWWVRVVLCFCSDWVVALGFVAQRLLWLLYLHQYSIVSLWSQVHFLEPVYSVELCSLYFCGCGDLELVWIFSVLLSPSCHPSWTLIWGISDLCVCGSGLFVFRSLARAGCSLVQGDSVYNYLCLCIEWGPFLPWHCGAWSWIWDLYFSVGLGLSVLFVSINIHSTFPFFVCSASQVLTINLLESINCLSIGQHNSLSLIFLHWFSHILRGSLWGCNLSGLCDCRGLTLLLPSFWKEGGVRCAI